MLNDTSGATAGFDMRERQDLILGQPPRIGPLGPEHFTQETHEIVAMVRRAALQAPADNVPDMTATLLRHTALFRKHLEFGVQLLGNGLMSPRDRELMVLRTGWLCQSPYEWGEHVRIGKQVGLTSEEIERVTQGSSAPGWDAHESALLRAVEECHEDAMISDETWATLALRMDDKQLIELPLVIGWYHAMAYFLNSLRCTLNGTNTGLSAR